MNTTAISFKSNKVSDIVVRFHTVLDPLYGHAEVQAFVEILFGAFLGWDRTRLLLARHDTIDQSDLLRLHWALHDLEHYRPVQHIVGHVDFCGCHIEVGPSVLIPRPETEELVAALARSPRWGKEGPRHVLDLCTGSGCIAIALKRAWPAAQVSALDLSATALATARRNAEANTAQVTFVQADLLQWPAEQPGLAADWQPSPAAQLGLAAGAKADLIVSNPPYVRQSESAAMSPNVLDYEPHAALFVPDDSPLLFYQAIGRVAQAHLAPGGLLALEINAALSGETLELIASMGFDAQLRHDFRGNPRFVAATPV